MDFEAGVQRVFHKPSSQLNVRTLWSGIAQCSNFFASLPWTVDGQELWQALVGQDEHVQETDDVVYPTILTGVPMNRAARGQKVQWCQRELISAMQKNKNKIAVHHVDMAGPKKKHECVHGYIHRNKKQNSCIQVITCWSKNKHYESGPGA